MPPLGCPVLVALSAIKRRRIFVFCNKYRKRLGFRCRFANMMTWDLEDANCPRGGAVRFCKQQLVAVKYRCLALSLCGSADHQPPSKLWATRRTRKEKP